MFCKNCGNQIGDSDAFCSKCGAANNAQTLSNQQNEQKQENPVWGILAIVFGALGGSTLGLVFSIVGLCIYKTPENKQKAWIGLGLTIAWMVIATVLLIIWFPAIVEWINQHIPAEV